ncbi:MAG: tyrosine-type recombinase/integrase [Acidithiobacillus sp.]|uniref:tyrosine-type recombinase/integrase n=1 Tax=Acidithiobacillus sp. TaxID=1872118 RepID=UPI003CFE6EF5
MIPVTGGTLLRRGKQGLLTYRLIPPAPLRKKIGRRQVWIALHTADLATAQRQAARLWLRMWDMADDPSFSLAFFLTRDGDLHITDIQPGEIQDAERILANHQKLLLEKGRQAVEAPVTAAAHPTAAAVLPSSVSVGENCSQAYALYKRERVQIAKAWKEATISGNDAAIELFQEVLGDLPMSEYGDENLRRFCEVVKLLPPHRKTSPLWRGKSLEEIIARAPGGQSPKNINKNIQFVAGFLDWYVKTHRDVLPRHSLRDHLIREGRHGSREHEEREAFSDAQVEAYCRASPASTPLQFWLIPLGAYTGARIGELAQLRVSDVEQVQDVWCFRIREGEGQDLKTKSAKRDVPVHPALIKAGFLEFVEEVRKDHPSGWLFQELADVKDKADTVSKWAGRVRKKVPGIDDDRHGFHSLRHTVATKLAGAKVDPIYRSDLLGHARSGTESDVRYAKTEIKGLAEAVGKIRYPFKLRKWPGLSKFLKDPKG